MKAIAISLVLLWAPLSALAQQVALVIGNSDYQSVTGLANPQNDSALIAKALAEQGFDVTVRDNLDLQGMRLELRAFRAKADQSDTAIVYYAGHGIEVGGTNFLVPVDANLADERDASIELVTVDNILSQISGARSMKMMVLDACRNNPFLAKMQRENSGRNVGRGLGRIDRADADTLIAYAAAAGEVTPDGAEGQNSPFTRAFVNALSGPPADIRRLLGVVRDEMRQTVPGAAPFVYSSLGGSEYVINPNSDDPTARASAEPPGGSDKAPDQAPITDQSIYIDFAKAEMIGTTVGWDDFLIRYDDFELHSLYALALGKKGLLERQEDRIRTAMSDAVDPAPAVAAQADGGAAQSDDGTAQTAALEPAPATPVFLAPEPALPAFPTPTPEPSAGATAATALPAFPHLSADEATRSIQEFLKEHGCYRGRIDGLLGRGSLAGLEEFSRLSGTPVTIDRDASQESLNSALHALLSASPVECKAPPATAARRGNTSSSRNRNNTRESARPGTGNTATSGKNKRSWGCAGQNDAYHCITE